MSLVTCKECGKQVSNSAVICPHCGYPLARRYAVSEIVSELSSLDVFALIIGIVLQIFALIVFFCFDADYIDMDTRFGSDYNSYTYVTYAYIATALRFGLSGILFGLGTLLECHRTRYTKTTYRG